eukprot:SAG11_NODE_20159_length_451_cov_1.136364_1_plen_42_part_00
MALKIRSTVLNLVLKFRGYDVLPVYFYILWYSTAVRLYLEV